jgi:hypothetical protein
VGVLPKKKSFLVRLKSTTPLVVSRVQPLGELL